jgi:hypothetical protein
MMMTTMTTTMMMMMMIMKKMMTMHHKNTDLTERTGESGGAEVWTVSCLDFSRMVPFSL